MADTTDPRTRLADAGLLALRLLIGVSLAWLHGRGKIASVASYVFSGHDWSFVKVVASLGFPFAGFFAVAAALAESAGAVLVAAGLAARLGGFLVMFTMGVAILSHLRAGQVPELALLYFAPALAVVLIGPGRYSLDALTFTKRHPEKALAQAAAAGD